MLVRRLNSWEQIAGCCNVAALVLLLVFFTSVSFAATAPLRSGPDPQFLRVEKEDTAATVPSGWRSYAGPRIAPCPGTRNVFSYDCLIQPHERAVRELQSGSDHADK